MAEERTESCHLPGVVLPTSKYEDDQEISSEGVTPLMIASYEGNVKRVQDMLQNENQTVQETNVYKATALDYAVDNNQLQVVDVLLGYGADLDLLDDDNRQTILHRCVLTAQLSKVETCVRIGANLDLRDGTGQTALHLAVQKGNVEIVFLLLKNSCDTTARNQEGFTAQEYAFFNDNSEIQRALSTYSFNNKAVGLLRGFLHGCVTGDVAIIEAVVAQYGESAVNFKNENIQNATGLFVACQNGHLPVVVALYKHGANLNHVVDSGDSPLIAAAIHNHPEIVRYLIKEGARINFRNILGRTALHCAVIEQYFAIVQILVENGALLNQKSENGSTAIFIAAEKNDFPIAKYLVDKGAYLDVADDRGITPLLMAVNHSNCNLDIIRYLAEHGANIDKSDDLQRTALMFAINQNKLSVVQVLVEHGVDIQGYTTQGQSITELALMSGSIEIHRYLIQVMNRPRQIGRQHQVKAEHRVIDVEALKNDLFAMIQSGSGTHADLTQLMEKGADINAKDNNGRTPLITAISNLNLNHVKWLTQEQVNTNLADNRGCPPLIHAVLLDSLPITELLLQTIDKHCAVSHAVGEAEPPNHVLNINQTDSNNKTALSHLAESHQVHADQIAIRLVQYGSHVNMVDSNGETVLGKCVDHGKSEMVHMLLKNGAQLEPLCPAILLEACLSSNDEIMSHLIKHLTASNSERLGLYINVLLNFAASNLSHWCLKSCIDEFPKPIARFSCKGRLLNGINTESLCEMLKYLSHESLFNIAQDESGNSLLMIAAAKGMIDVVTVLRQKGADPHHKNVYGYDAIHQSLQSGHYEVAAELCTSELLVLEHSDSLEDQLIPDKKSDTESGFITKEKCLEKHMQETKSLWMETLKVVYEAVILKLIRNPHRLIKCITRGWKEPVLYIHLSPSTSDLNTIQYIRETPHIDMYRIEVLTTTQGPAKLLTLQQTRYTTNIARILNKTYVLVRDSSRDRSTKLVRLNGLYGHLVCVLKDPSCHSYWAVTTVDAIDLTAVHCSINDNFASNRTSSYQPKGYFVNKCHRLKSVNCVALPIENSDGLRQSEFCFAEHVFCGKDLSLLGRSVRKLGHVRDNSEGVVTDVNVSFQDQDSHFYNGAFAVSCKAYSKPSSEAISAGSTMSAVPKTRPFAVCGDSGAAVIDKDSGVVLGLVLASYNFPDNQVIFCLRLDYALNYLSETYNLTMGRFRTFSDKLKSCHI